jgi:outer membrane protein assembly factor BamB
MLALALLFGMPVWSVPAVHADETTVSVDNLRTGWDPNESALAPSSVSGAGFGRRFSTPVDGQVIAQPIVAGRTVIVATENDKVYGLDRTTGAVRWSQTIGSPWPSSAIACADLAPNVGTTGTPVYDPSSGTVYMTDKDNNGSDTSHPNWYMHALDAQTGAERAGWPVHIQGKAGPGNGTNTFNAYTAQQRPGLLLLGGAVYAGFASHCDHGPYVGWVVGVNQSTRAMHLWTTESLANNAMGGIWQSGGGLLSDGPGRILFATGNGTTTPVGPGSPTAPERAESVVRLAVNPDGSMNSKDLFAPANANALDSADRDLGSGGPAGLPGPQFGTSAYPHLLVEAGKSDSGGTGHVWLLNRDNLGGRGQGSGGGDAVLGVTTLKGFAVWGHPGVWGGDGGYVYFTPSDGHLQAFKYSVSSGKPSLTAAGQSSDTFPYGSGSPVVTSNGTTSGSALVWVIRDNGSNSDLRAYDANPTGSLNLRWSSATGGTKFTASKFSVPATDGGWVYIGTRDGHVIAFGTQGGMVAGNDTLEFGGTAVGATSTLAETIQNRGVSGEKVAATTSPSAPFTVTGMPPTGITIPPGGRVNLRVTFAPTALGAFNDSLSITGTDGSETTTTTVRISGSGAGAVPSVDSGANWQLNGSAMLNGPDLELTSSTAPRAEGSAFYRSAVPSANVHATFNATLTGDGNGLTFSMLDAAQEQATALGAGGGGLGYAGLHGVAVTLDTNRNRPADPSGNFVSVATGGTGDQLTYSAVAANVPDLRGTHRVDVTVTHGRIRVKIDGVQYLDATVTVAPNVLVGFTGATAGHSAMQFTDSTAITY